MTSVIYKAMCYPRSFVTMAKTKELSEDIRSAIISKHKASKGYKVISKNLGIPVSTVRNVIKKFAKHGTVKNLPGGGGKRKIDERSLQRLVWIRAVKTNFAIRIQFEFFKKWEDSSVETDVRISALATTQIKVYVVTFGIVLTRWQGAAHQQTELESINPENLKSIVWKNVGFPSRNRKITSRESVICKLCCKSLKYHSTTSNMSAHLHSMHYSDYAEQLASEEEPQLKQARITSFLPPSSSRCLPAAQQEEITFCKKRWKNYSIIRIFNIRSIRNSNMIWGEDWQP